MDKPRPGMLTCLIMRSSSRSAVARFVHGSVDAHLYPGEARDLLASMPDECTQLIVTSPPYNNGKAYEERAGLAEYLVEQSVIIGECHRVLKPGGSLCWQVGNHIPRSGEVLPLDILLYPLFADLGLRLRNRIVWHYEHGLHNRRRFSGRYETILWFTKGDGYQFDLDPVRVPQKYPGKKYHRGAKAGEYSSNPKGKNPGDVWIIPNVKHNHIDKTVHPCQFPIELVERLILPLTAKGDIVLDPYAGVASTLIAAILNGRRGIGAEVVDSYVAVGLRRLSEARAGVFRFRPRSRRVYVPDPATAVARRPESFGGVLDQEPERRDPAVLARRLA